MRRLAAAAPAGLLCAAVWLKELGGDRGLDWHNYVWAAEMARSGVDPYAAWATLVASQPSEQWAGRADLLPLQLLLYMGVLGLGGSIALLAFFGLAHVVSGMLIHVAGRSWLAYYWAALPVIGDWFLRQPSNKSVFAALALLMLLSIRGRRKWLALGLAIVLGNLTWVGFMVTPILLLRMFTDWRSRCLAIAVAVGASVIANLPYFPSWFIVYQFRGARVTGELAHTSPLWLLEFLVGPSSIVPIVGLVALAGLAYWLAWRSAARTELLAACAMCALLVWRTDADPPSLLLASTLLLVGMPSTLLVRLVAAATFALGSVGLIDASWGSWAYIGWSNLVLAGPVVLLIIHAVSDRTQVGIARVVAARSGTEQNSYAAS